MSKPAPRPSRSLRKRQPVKLADDIDFDLETMLEEHEQSGVEYRAKRDAKRLKSEEVDPEEEKYRDAFKGYDIPFDSLPALCIERIFAMVSVATAVRISFTYPDEVQLIFSLSLAGLFSGLIQPRFLEQVPDVPRHP